uniref:RING-type domain-containing protein n=1 Tax=Steinernema glaseri TaxID=37863 RepID=A0A1I7Y8L8_9BILA
MDFSRQLDYATLELAGRVISVPGNVRAAYIITYTIFLASCAPLLFLEEWTLVNMTIPFCIGNAQFTLLALALFRNTQRKMFLASFTVFIGMLSMAFTQVGLFYFAQAVKFRSYYVLVFPFVFWNFAGIFVLALFYFYRLYNYMEIEEQKALIICHEAEKQKMKLYNYMEIEEQKVLIICHEAEKQKMKSEQEEKKNGILYIFHALRAAYDPVKASRVRPSCLKQYDSFHSPQVLPCGHTFCDICLRRQRRKRCPSCGSKFRGFNLNAALKALVDNLRYLTEVQEEKSERCDECDDRYPLRWIRTCHTCKENIQKMVSHNLLQCHICLECCINRHNGHYFTRIDLGLAEPARSYRTTSVIIRSSSTPQTRNATPSSSRFYSTIIDPLGAWPQNQSVENHTYFTDAPGYINIGAGEEKKCHL